MSSVRKVQAHERIPGFEHGHEHRHVGLCARVRLDIGPLRIVNAAQTLYGQTLHFVHHLTAAVVTRTGVPLRIFIRKNRTHGLHYLVADEVLRGDEFDTVLLTRTFRSYKFENLFITSHI